MDEQKGDLVLPVIGRHSAPGPGPAAVLASPRQGLAVPGSVLSTVHQQEPDAQLLASGYVESSPEAGVNLGSSGSRSQSLSSISYLEDLLEELSCSYYKSNLLPVASRYAYFKIHL